MRRHPFIYEINTWVWLDALSRRDGTPERNQRDWMSLAKYTVL